MEGFKSNTKMQCFKEGGSVKYESRKEHKEEMSADVAKDKALVKKAFKIHDTQSHEGEKTNLSKLRKGGRAKKDCGTVKKYKTGGSVENAYGAKKTDKDIKDIANSKNQKPKMLCGGSSVSKMAEGGQPGATEAQQKFYDKNKAAAKKKEAEADYEAFGSRGDAARKGMAEGRMDALGNPYKKGGGIKKCATGGSLKEVDVQENPGLAKLPTDVRNKMGYMRSGGKAKKMNTGGTCS